MKKILETERLILREWTLKDESTLKKFLQDEEVMYAYEHRFSDEEVTSWLRWNLDSYQKNGYGLWAMELKETGEVIGECGLTNQLIHELSYQEIGYHLCKEYWKKGYAIEAAQAVKNFAFHQYHFEEVVSIVRDTNLASMNVAIRNQMVIKERVIKQYRAMQIPHYIFSVKKPSPSNLW